LKPTLRNLILTLFLAVVMFFWIWFSAYLGTQAYWVALISFAVCIAYGASLVPSLPYMAVAAVGGTVLGLGAFALAMKILPLYYGLSIAIAGAIFVLVAGLLSVAKLRELLPMNLIGLGAFLGAMTRFDFLFTEQPIQGTARTIQTFFGVIFGLLFGMLLAAVLQVLVLAPRHAAAAAQVPAEPPKIMD
jgi:hypothetical protein